MKTFKAPKTLEMLQSFILSPKGEEAPSKVGFEFYSLPQDKKDEIRELASMLQNNGVTCNFASDFSMKMLRQCAARKTLSKICDMLSDEITAQTREDAKLARLARNAK